jgi:hypothetical protein
MVARPRLAKGPRAAHAPAGFWSRFMTLRFAVFASLLLLCAACTEADREAMFSAKRAPLIAKCDEQPGYPPPHQRPGCEYFGITTGGK